MFIYVFSMKEIRRGDGWEGGNKRWQNGVKRRIPLTFHTEKP